MGVAGMGVAGMGAGSWLDGGARAKQLTGVAPGGFPDLFAARHARDFLDPVGALHPQQAR